MKAPPPPQDSAQRWAVFGIVVLVAGGATCAATTFKAHYAPAPLPPSAPPDFIPAKAPPPVLVDDAPSTASTDGEPPPTKRGTPQASLAARPAWGKVDIDAPSVQYAPQHSRPAEMFAAATPLLGDLQRGFVVCRAQPYDAAHPWAYYDLRFRATFGAAPMVVNKGPYEKKEVFVTAPLVDLHTGDAVTFDVFDHEYDGPVPIRKRTVQFAGKPLVLDDAHAPIECRELSGSSLEKRMSAQLTAADAAVGRLPARHLAGYAPNWGWPDEVGAAETATSDAAALAGWDDYRVKKRVERIAGEITRLEGERPAIFAELLHRGAKGGDAGAVSAAFPNIQCKKTCTVIIHLKNTGDQPWQWGMDPGPTGYVATAKSGIVALSPERPDDPSIVATPGQETTIRLVPADAKIDLTKDPAIVGVCSQGRCVALRAR